MRILFDHVTPRGIAPFFPATNGNRGSTGQASACAGSMVLLIPDAATYCVAPESQRFLEEKMKISARNVLEGKIQNVTKGAVNAQVTLVLPGGEDIVSIITNSSVDRLSLVEGKAAHAIVKASEVMVGKGVDDTKLSARNVLAGEVTSLLDGAVNSEVAIKLYGGAAVVASITRESVQALELKVGDKVSAIVKASNVMIGV
jgi:molybdate transport system regulatory protein